MSSPEGSSPAVAGDGRDGKGRTWYRRRAVLVAVLLIAVVIVTVVSDLPEHASRPAQISSDASVVRQVNADLASCAYAVGEAYTIYRDKLSSTLSQSDSARVPSLLRDDQAACSFTDESIFDLSNIEVTGSVAGEHLQDLVGTVTLWTTADALGAIEAVQTLFSHPGDRAAQRQLSKATMELAEDRRKALAEIAAVNRALATRMPTVNLPVIRTA